MRHFDAAPHAINSVVSDPKLDEIDRPTAVDRIAQQPGLTSLICAHGRGAGTALHRRR
jgi:hypothetical protein